MFEHDLNCDTNCDIEDIENTTMNKCKKRRTVLCLITFLGVINILSLNTFSLLSKLSYLINVNKDFLNTDDNFVPPNVTKIQDIVLKPATNVQWTFSHLPKTIRSNEDRWLDLLGNDTIAKKMEVCPVLKERLVLF